MKQWVIVRHGVDEHDVAVVGPFDSRDAAESYAVKSYEGDEKVIGWFPSAMIEPCWDGEELSEERMLHLEEKARQDYREGFISLEQKNERLRQLDERWERGSR